MFTLHARALALSVSVLLAGASSASTDEPARVVSPRIEWSGEALDRFDPSWLHLKFDEGLTVDLAPATTPAGARFAADGDVNLDEVNHLLEGALTIRRTFPGDRAQFRAWKAKGEAASGQPGPDLSLWFDVELPEGRNNLATLLNALNALGPVEIAHPAPICEPAVIMTPAPAPAPIAATMGTPDFTSQQDYLFDTPIGLDAPSAWAHAGGRGMDMKFIDVELGWVHAHEEFNQANLFHTNGNNSSDTAYRDHGTAVVGEVVGMNNGFGITGFASDAQWGTVGILINEWPNVPHRFLEAAQALDPGDAWLIELQMYPSGRSATPMEWLQANYDAIWTSCWSLGVVCIEAGANGSQDLDHPSWGGVFDRNVRDSGAIMVGAGTPTGRIAEWFTNYGSRMDVHAWGSAIVTTGYGDLYSEGSATTEYTAGFGGTSGASPMITGSALCLQGIAKNLLGAPLSPADLRQLLNETGIPNLGSQYIGPRPDLGAAVEQLEQGTSTTVDAFSITTGTLLGGDLDDLRDSDDLAVHVRSGFGQSFSDLHKMEALIHATTTAANPGLIDITIESRISEPSGTLQIRLRNWSTSQFVSVGSFAVNASDTQRTVNDVPAANYVNASGEIEVLVRHVVFVPQFAFMFESWIDQVVIGVE